MSSLLALLRDDLRDFAGYASARSHTVPGRVWLNANESPWPNPADTGLTAHRYPAPQPAPLLARMSSVYGVPAERLLLGRGSDEAIDLLVRGFCRPGRDAIVIAPPVFGMYAVSARLQAAPLLEVPLRDTDAGFVADLDTMAASAELCGAKILFLCSPANPTGQALDPDAVVALAWRLEGRCLVVVDEAYAEYADAPSLATRAGRPSNLAVLRTLSKAHALAAARIGTLIGAPELVQALRVLQAPYPLPSPCVQLALEGLAPAALAQTRARVQVVRGERARLLRQLPGLPGVRRVYPSQGNYVLARFTNADASYQRLLAAGVVVRDQRAMPQLGDALRISVGTPAENDALLAALRGSRSAA
jgi:histidinol-phosphate aminotransferase